MNWNIFKKKSRDVWNVYHDEIRDKIELAFEVGPAFNRVKYYRFKAAEDSTAEFEQRTGRYIWITSYLKQSARKMDDKTIKGFLEDLKKNLSGEKNGQINLSNAFRIIHTMEALTNLAFESELVKRLASVVYFDDTEDIRSYSREYGEKKIKFWDKYDKDMSFFLSMPIVELYNLRGISPEDLRKFIAEREEIVNDLTLVTPTSS